MLLLLLLSLSSVGHASETVVVETPMAAAVEPDSSENERVAFLKAPKDVIALRDRIRAAYNTNDMRGVRDGIAAIQKLPQPLDRVRFKPLLLELARYLDLEAPIGRESGLNARKLGAGEILWNCTGGALLYVPSQVSNWILQGHCDLNPMYGPGAPSDFRTVFDLTSKQLSDDLLALPESETVAAVHRATTSHQDRNIPRAVPAD